MAAVIAQAVGDAGSFVALVGEVELVGGYAEIALDGRFPELCGARDYHVFLTSYDTAAVFVQNRSRDGFEIHMLPAVRAKRCASVRCAYLLVTSTRSTAFQATLPVADSSTDSKEA